MFLFWNSNKSVTGHVKNIFCFANVWRIITGDQWRKWKKLTCFAVTGITRTSRQAGGAAVRIRTTRAGRQTTRRTSRSRGIHAIRLFCKTKTCQIATPTSWWDSPFLGAFFEFPILSLTSNSRFSSSCFFSAICSSLDLPGIFLSTKNEHTSSACGIDTKIYQDLLPITRG